MFDCSTVVATTLLRICTYEMPPNQHIARWHLGSGAGVALRQSERSAATWTDLGIFTLSEAGQRRRNSIQHPLHVDLKRNDTKEINYPTLTDLEKEFMVAV